MNTEVSKELVPASPLPWNNERSSYVVMSGANKVCEMYTSTSYERDEDSSYIVRACNAFPDLLASLKALLANVSNIEVLGEWEALEINRTIRKTQRAKVDVVIKAAREAIRKATQI